MYYAPWILLVLVTLWIGLASFFWALESGQLDDQQRARYLPLMDEGTGEPAANAPPDPGQPGRRVPWEVWGLLLIAGACLGLFSVPVLGGIY